LSVVADATINFFKALHEVDDIEQLVLILGVHITAARTSAFRIRAYGSIRFYDYVS
jgi:hypothetical protein